MDAPVARGTVDVVKRNAFRTESLADRQGLEKTDASQGSVPEVTLRAGPRPSWKASRHVQVLPDVRSCSGGRKVGMKDFDHRIVYVSLAWWAMLRERSTPKGGERFPLKRHYAFHRSHFKKNASPESKITFCPPNHNAPPRLQPANPSGQLLHMTIAIISVG